MDFLENERVDVALRVIDQAVKGSPCDKPLLTSASLAAAGISAGVKLCHALSTRSGWWHDLKTGQLIDATDPHVFAAKLALIHSEVSEALEGGRKGLYDSHLPHHKAVAVELADAVIRIFDLAGALDLDLAAAMIEKLAYNQTRADHTPERRRGDGGKAI